MKRELDGLVRRGKSSVTIEMVLSLFVTKSRGANLEGPTPAAIGGRLGSRRCITGGNH